MIITNEEEKIYINLLNSKEKNRKKKKYFPDYYLNRGYLQNSADSLARKYYFNKLTRTEIEAMCSVSRYSLQFWTIRGYKEKEAIKNISIIQSSISNKRKEKDDYKLSYRKSSPRCIEYWTSRGYSEEESVLNVQRIQCTFSLKICIEKYGVEKGQRIWSKRQQKRQETLKSKPLEEVSRINKLKNIFDLDNCVNRHGIVEGTLQYEKNIHRAKTMAGLNGKTSSKEATSVFDELLMIINLTINENVQAIYGSREFYIEDPKNNKYNFYDFTLPDYNIIVEYNGIAWHPREDIIDWKPIYKTTLTVDEIIQNNINKMLLAEENGFKIFTIWSDFTESQKYEIFEEIVDSIIERNNENN